MVGEEEGGVSGIFFFYDGVPVFKWKLVELKRAAYSLFFVSETIFCEPQMICESEFIS